MNKKLYIGKRNYIVDVLLVGGNDLNMSYLSIPPLWTGFKMSEGAARGFIRYQTKRWRGSAIQRLMAQGAENLYNCDR